MKCDQASTWLMMSDAPADPPEPVLRHLELCEMCRETQRTLVHLETSTAELLPRQECEHSMNRFLEQVKTLPVRGAPTVARANSTSSATGWTFRNSAVAYVAIASAVCIAFLGGWMVASSRPGPPRSESVGTKPHFADPSTSSTVTNQESGNSPRSPQAAPSTTRVAILGPIVDNHIHLAIAEQPTERFVLLAQLSDILWGETLQQIEAGSTEGLPQLSAIYSHVVGNSLVDRSRSLRREDDAARAKVVSRLRDRKLEAQRRTHGTVPLIGDLLLQMGQRSEFAAQWIDSTESPPREATRNHSEESSGDLVTTLVARSVRLAEEEDPLLRAELSCDVADQLSQTIVFTSLSGNADTSEQLGVYLDDVVQRGVMVNLARFKPSGDDDPRLVAYNRVMQRSHHAREVLQSNLERAPEAARKGLLRALEAQSRGRGKGPPHARGSNEDRGPPGRRNGFIPPGLNK